MHKHIYVFFFLHILGSYIPIYFFWLAIFHKKLRCNAFKKNKLIFFSVIINL